MSKRYYKIKYFLSDLCASAIAWAIFFIYRKIYVEPHYFGYEIPVSFNSKFFMGIIFVSAFWVILFYLAGYYRNVLNKSRLLELWNTFLSISVGSIIIFFALILDDYVSDYKYYYFSFLVLFSLQFFLTYIPRVIFTTITIGKIRHRKIKFKTLIVGTCNEILRVFKGFEFERYSSGYEFIGYIKISEGDSSELDKNLKDLGSLMDVREIIQNNKVEHVILAISPDLDKEIKKAVSLLQGTQAEIKIIPEMYNNLKGSLNIAPITGIPLVRISHELLPAWQENMKRIIDISASVFALIVFFPVFLVLSIIIKLTSKGPIFYTHERIGKFGRPFMIYKFRSMYTDAEKHGPALAKDNDSRITPIGRIIRKTRLDEIPQFYNVLRGEMSLVGPRPERQFFIDQIVKKAPEYYHLQKVRPGITSWGQVKYGYAENVDEMVERLKFDLIYIEDMSLYVDFKILIHTVLIVFKAVGK